MERTSASATAVTKGPLYPWFGYYDMPVWDLTGRYLLSLVVAVQDRPPTGDVGLGGKLGLGLNFARIAGTRPGYGYAGLPDPFQDELHPARDGVYGIDMSEMRQGRPAREDWPAVSIWREGAHP